MLRQIPFSTKPEMGDIPAPVGSPWSNPKSVSMGVTITRAEKAHVKRLSSGPVQK